MSRENLKIVVLFIHGGQSRCHHDARQATYTCVSAKELTNTFRQIGCLFNELVFTRTSLDEPETATQDRETAEAIEAATDYMMAHRGRAADLSGNWLRGFNTESESYAAWTHLHHIIRETQKRDQTA